MAPWGSRKIASKTSSIPKRWSAAPRPAASPHSTISTSSSTGSRAPPNGLKTAAPANRDARTGKWTLHFDADELNGNHPFDYPLADETGSVLDRYLNDMRPRLLPQGESPYLFPGANGKPILQATLSQQLTKWDTRLRGVEPHQALTPSLVRDMVEHTCLLFLPGNGPLVAAALLQVSRIKTRDQHLLDEVGRAAIQRDDRMDRWANQEDLGPEEIRKLLNELKTNSNDWRRFVKAVHDLKASA